MKLTTKIISCFSIAILSAVAASIIDIFIETKTGCSVLGLVISISFGFALSFTTITIILRRKS